MKVSTLFAWYDIWVGLFWDKNKRWLYILPIPMFGIILKFKPKQPHFYCGKETMMDGKRCKQERDRCKAL